MPHDPVRYTLTELANLSRLTPRTIRYYISQGLLAAPARPGPGPKYTDGDLARLGLIRQLQREHQPLAEIRAQLDGMDDEAVLRLVEQPGPPRDSALDYIRGVTGGHRLAEARAPLAMPSIAPTAPAAPALEPPAEARLARSQWERLELTPGVELHIRRPLARQTAKRVDRIVAIARAMLEEEPQ